MAEINNCWHGHLRYASRALLKRKRCLGDACISTPESTQCRTYNMFVSRGIPLSVTRDKSCWHSQWSISLCAGVTNAETSLCTLCPTWGGHGAGYI